jgi:hypothetical protein
MTSVSYHTNWTLKYWGNEIDAYASIKVIDMMKIISMSLLRELSALSGIYLKLRVTLRLKENHL